MSLNVTSEDYLSDEQFENENLLQENETISTSRKRSLETSLEEREYKEEEEPDCKKMIETIDDLAEQLTTNNKVLEMLEADRDKIAEDQSRRLQELIYNHKFIRNEAIERQKEDLNQFLDQQKRELDKMEQCQEEEKTDLMTSNTNKLKEEEKKVEEHKKSIQSIKEKMKNHFTRSEEKSCEPVDTSSIATCPHCLLPLLPPTLIAVLRRSYHRKLL